MFYYSSLLEPPSPSEPLTPREQRAADALCILQELAQIGMDMARVCGRRMQAQEQMDEVAPGCVPTLQAAELSLAFDRIARSIRLTLALKAKDRKSTRLNSSHRH